MGSHTKNEIYLLGGRRAALQAGVWSYGRRGSGIAPILRIGDQVLTFDVFWPKHLQEVRSTVYIHGQSI